MIALEYAAGIIDGEGSIHFAKVQRKYDTIQVKVTMTGRVVQDSLRERFGGSVYLTRKTPQKPQHRPTWTWQVVSAQAIRVLEELRPHLLVKASQADCAFAFGRTVGAPGKRVSDETRAQRDALIAQMKLLNRRGVPL